MAKAILFYARPRRPPIPKSRVVHTLRRRGPLLVDRDEVDAIDVLGPTPPQARSETVEHPG